MSVALRRSLFPALLSLAGACAQTDRPVAPDSTLPAEANLFLSPDSVRTQTVAEGVLYRYAWTSRGPWAVHLVSADLGRCELSLAVVPALEPGGSGRLRRPVSRLRPASVVPLAGVNGDFFFAESGGPMGSEVTEDTRRTVRRPALAWIHGRPPWIGVPEVDEAGARFGPGLVTESDGPRPAFQVVGGFPELLDGGAVAGDLGVEDNPRFARARHPRTAVGFDTDGNTLWFVVVDGRQGSYSDGMSLPELAGLFLSLGVEEALNLDGGGSSAMLVLDSLVSRPSDDGGERPVTNSLWIGSDDSSCPVDETSE